MQAIDDLGKYRKIINRGTILQVEIKVTLKKEKKERIEFVFEIELLEDLYIYSKARWKNPEPNLLDCACSLINETAKRLGFFEVIHATSLNNAYEKIFAHFFANLGSPTCNAFDRFFLTQKE